MDTSDKFARKKFVNRLKGIWGSMESMTLV